MVKNELFEDIKAFVDVFIDPKNGFPVVKIPGIPSRI